MVSMILTLSLGVAGAAVCTSAAPPSAPVAYTLSFPEAGLDDSAAYAGYRTRFFRDAAANTFQVYVKESEGRVVNLWANAANESVGFTARDGGGAPARLDWAGDSACVSSSGADRVVEYQLLAAAPELRIGHFVLGSMRVERDVQYGGHHMRPFGPPFVLPELRALVDELARLPEAVRQRHLTLLDAGGIADLHGRLQPTVRIMTRGIESVARIEQPSFDARNRLVLELAVPSADGQLALDGHILHVRARSGVPLVLTVRATTDAAALTPLPRSEIFNAAFFAFHDSLRLAHDRAVAALRVGAAADPRVQRYRRIERQVRGLELVSSREKLMAGLPNYATYFGRDILVTALLMQPIWASAMNEHVLASVLRKLAPDGQVSHEEALGGQAIREHAAAYVTLIAEWRRQSAADDATAARQTLERAQALLANMQQVRENYAMVDDEFQLPILAARYLTDPAVPAARKRAFLSEAARPDDPASRLALLLRNLMLVANMTTAYARQPISGNLISFQERQPGRFQAASWRDSGAGYGNGRFAMDVNTIWVPQALASTAAILRSLQSLGYDEDLESAATMQESVLGGYIRDPAALDRAIDTWRGAARHFAVDLSAAEVHERIARRLASLPAAEARYWTGVLSRAEVPADGVEFLALSLDGGGRPVAVLSTDLGMRWFLDDITEGVLRDPARMSAVLSELSVPFQPYPIGLFVERFGPLVANDAYATPEVWEGFERDDYHSPRVVWGREVNLLLLGLMRQIDAAHDATGQLRDDRLRPYVAALGTALRRMLEAVEASGLKHNELWSYRIEDDRLLPVRWGRSTDIQLWNLTNLAVEFLLARAGRR